MFGFGFYMAVPAISSDSCNVQMITRRGSTLRLFEVRVFMEISGSMSLAGTCSVMHVVLLLSAQYKMKQASSV